MLIYINGFMGSGKTTLLKKWRKSWSSWSLKSSEKSSESTLNSFDFDECIADHLNTAPRDLGSWIESHGWGEFRSLERNLLEETLRQEQGLYALGGGTLVSEQNCELVKKNERAKVLWLNTPVEVCWERVKTQTHRPLVKKDKKAFFELYEQRLSFYKICDLQIRGEDHFKEIVPRLFSSDSG